MSFVLDSNILVKLVVTEPGSEQARTTVTRFLERGCSLYTVDLALAESLNALWKHAKMHEDLETEDAKSAAQDLNEIYDKLNVLTTLELSEQALDIALTKNITVYDSLFISAARKLKASLYTADQKLHNISENIATSKSLKLP